MNRGLFFKIGTSFNDQVLFISYFPVYSSHAQKALHWANSAVYDNDRLACHLYYSAIYENSRYFLAGCCFVVFSGTLPKKTNLVVDAYLSIFTQWFNLTQEGINLT